MEIYLIRHAHSPKLSDCEAESDQDRPLGEKGQHQSRTLALSLQERNVQPEVILSTPLLRAKQTAEIMVESWQGTKPKLVIEKRLTPECKPRKLKRILQEQEKEHVAVVGHEPDLGWWASWLIGSSKANIQFAKAGVAHIHWEDKLKKGTGTLLWLVTPDWYSPTPERASTTNPEEVEKN